MAEHFAKATLDLLRDPDLSDGDRIVYLTLLTFADFATLANCRPSAQAVADRSCRSRAAVVRSLKSLVATGWITREHRSDAHGQAPSLYAFPRQRGSQMSRTLGSQMSHDQDPVTPKPKRSRRLPPMPTPSYLPRPDAADIQAREGVTEREALRRCKVYK
jgi:predicted transcriptional regulator